MSKRRFEYKVGWSSKFWEIELVDCAGVWAVTTHYGKTHTKGTSTTKKFARNKKAAEAFIASKVREKLQKGYVEDMTKVHPVNQLTIKKASRSTKEDIQELLGEVADEVKNSLPAGIQSEVIVTVIIGNEVLQESRK